LVWGMWSLMGAQRCLTETVVPDTSAFFDTWGEHRALRDVQSKLSSQINTCHCRPWPHCKCMCCCSWTRLNRAIKGFG
jgi:hypothetical protein